MQALGFVAFGAGLVPFGFIVLLIVAVTGGRNEPDPDAERPAALYYAGVMFIALFTALFAVFTVVASLLNLTLDKNGGWYGYSPSGSISTGASSSESGIITVRPGVNGQIGAEIPRRGEHDSDWANVVRGLVIAAVAIGVYRYTDRRRRGCALGPVGERVRKTYLYAASFVATVIYVVAGTVALYGIFEIIAPGVTRSGTRGESAVHFFQALFLAVAAGALWMLHLREVEPVSTAAIGIAPVAPPPEPEPAPRAPRAPRAAKKAAPVKKAAKKRT